MSSARKDVLGLYRRLLRLHQKLPGDFGSVGTRFVQQEFKGHRDASPDHARLFLREWSTYAQSLETQLKQKDSLSERTKDNEDIAPVGQGLSKNDLDMFSEQQLMQLLELLKETSKPTDSRT